MGARLTQAGAPLSVFRRKSVDPEGPVEHVAESVDYGEDGNEDQDSLHGFNLSLTWGTMQHYGVEGQVSIPQVDEPAWSPFAKRASERERPQNFRQPTILVESRSFASLRSLNERIRT